MDLTSLLIIGAFTILIILEIAWCLSITKAAKKINLELDNLYNIYYVKECVVAHYLVYVICYGCGSNRKCIDCFIGKEEAIQECKKLNSKNKITN